MQDFVWRSAGMHTKYSIFDDYQYFVVHYSILSSTVDLSYTTTCTYMCTFGF